MWNDLLTWFNDKTALLKGWSNDTEKLIYAAIPVAAFVYFVVKVISRRSQNKRPPDA
jgi:hypothetical protein